MSLKRGNGEPGNRRANKAGTGEPENWETSRGRIGESGNRRGENPCPLVLSGSPRLRFPDSPRSQAPAWDPSSAQLCCGSWPGQSTEGEAELRAAVRAQAEPGHEGKGDRDREWGQRMADFSFSPRGAQECSPRRQPWVGLAKQSFAQPRVPRQSLGTRERTGDRERRQR
jgi:hypothetical protein